MKKLVFIEKSRRDDTLLTVGFNLLMIAGNHANAVETHCNASLQDNAQRYCINANFINFINSITQVNSNILIL